MTVSTPALAGAFKGIAVFTPAGDLVYCVDPHKRSHWHMDLCVALQENLGLAEPPFFLLPCYTATVDCWVDSSSQELVTVAEAYPKVMRFQALLNVVFGLKGVRWQPNYTSGEACAPSLLDVHRRQFPELWHPHELIMEVTGLDPMGPATIPAPPSVVHQGHRYCLFVSSDETAATERILQLLHTTLEQELETSYSLQVIDVRKHPDKAEADLVSVTPTLIRTHPSPLRRLAGDVTSRERLVAFLQPL